MTSGLIVRVHGIIMYYARNIYVHVQAVVERADARASSLLVHKYLLLRLMKTRGELCS